MSTIEQILDNKGRQVYSVSPGATALDAANLMNENHIGALVVMDGEKMVGIFTERDMLCRVVAARRDAAETVISDVMTSPVACCTPQTTRDECQTVMRERRLRHLPVVKDGRLLGMISIGDVNQAHEAAQQQTIEYLYEYIVGEWKE